MNEDPAAWATSAGTPESALGGLQLKNGAYKDESSDTAASAMMTSWALAALMHQPFSSYPKDAGTALEGFVFKPQILSAGPKDHTKYTDTHSVLIKAKYSDGEKAGRVGTGVDVKACRVYVDKVSRTKQAKIGAHVLSLKLENVPNGSHTYKLRIVDNAGNVTQLERGFTVAVPAPTPTPTVAPTYTPPYVAPTTSPTPSTTLYPTPTVSDSGSAYPSASSSAYPAGTVSGAPIPSLSPSGRTHARVSAGGTGTGGFVGATLLAMLPLGVAASYLAINRREHAMDPATEGKVLGGGGSPWDRVKRSVGSLKDLFKPAGR